MTRPSNIKQFILIVMPLSLFFIGCRKEQPQSSNADQLTVAAQKSYGAREYEKSKESLSEAIVQNIELKRDSILGENYFFRAKVQRLLGQYDSALADFKSAAEHFRLIGNKSAERNARIELAEFYYTAHAYSYAATLAADAAASGKFYNDRPAINRALLIAAKANHKLEHYPKEIEILDELTQESNRSDDEQTRTEIFNCKLEAYAASGEYGALRKSFAQWATEETGAGGNSAAARVNFTLGCVQESAGHADSAVRYYSRSLTLLDKRTDSHLEQKVLLSLGNAAYRSKHIDQARRYYGDALELVRQGDDIVSELLLNISLIACDWKGNSSSRDGIDELARRMASIKTSCHEIGFSLGEAFADVLLGRCAERNDDVKKEYELFAEAQQLFEQYDEIEFDELPSLQLIKVVMDEDQIDPEDAILQQDCSQEHVAGVFGALEQKNLHDILRFFSRLTFRTSDGRLNQYLADLEWKRKTLHMLEEDILWEIAKGKEKDARRVQELQDLHYHRLQDLDIPATEIETLNPNYLWLVHQKSLTLKEVQLQLAPNTALVEYAPLATSVYCIVVTHDSAYIRKSNVSRQTILSMIHEYNRLLSDTRLNAYTASFDEWGAIDRINELSQALYNFLLAPAAPLLNDIHTLYIVPPAEFEWLAFHTLRSQNAGKSVSMFDKLALSYLPSAAALFFRHENEKSVETVIGFGHQGKTAWDVEYELKDIRSFYDKAKMIFDTSATIDRFRQLHCDVLHVGAEFILNTEVPDNSVMTVSDGVTPDGIQEISLGGILAVPAPQTLLFSDISPVPGGLSRYAAMGLLANGSPTIIATMWQGERKAKKYFGEVFYTSLMSGMTSAQAYRQAMVAMTKREESSPLHRWGLFFRYGK